MSQTNEPLLRNFEWRIIVEIENLLLVALKWLLCSVFKCIFTTIQNQISNPSIDKWQCAMQSKQHVPFGFDLNCFQTVFFSVVFVVAILFSFFIYAQCTYYYVEKRAHTKHCHCRNTIYLLSSLENWKYLTRLGYQYRHFWVYNTRFA